MKYLVLLAAWLSLSACATVVRGAKDTATFESSPTGATVTTNSISEDQLGPYTCLTPCDLELKRKRTWRVDFALDGHKPVSALLVPEVTGGGVAAGAGNLIAGGIIGIGIDAGTGANLDLMPNPMIAELVPLSSSENSRVLNAEEIVDDITDEDIVATDDDTISADGDNVQAMESEISSDNIDSLDANNGIPEVEETDIDLEPAVMDGSNIEVENLSQKSSQEQTPKLYKPGEVAPNDEVADDLNRHSLELINPAAIRNDKQ